MPTTEGTDGPAQRAGSLPETARAGLREAFADEVTERLPRLRAAAASLDPDELGAVLRDVHTLGSSAYVVGEDEAARVARRAELALSDGGALEAFAELVEELDGLLADWVR